MFEDRILVAEQSVIQQLSILALSRFDRWSERPNLINCLVKPLQPLWMSQMYSSNCSCSKHLTIFILKVLDCSGWVSIVLRKKDIGFPGYDNIKLHLMVRLQSWSLGNAEYPFINITSKSTWTQNGITCEGGLFMDQIELFNRLLWIIIISYLKPYSCMHIVLIRKE